MNGLGEFTYINLIVFVYKAELQTGTEPKKNIFTKPERKIYLWFPPITYSIFIELFLFYFFNS
jgi:hypothetical protein